MARKSNKTAHVLNLLSGQDAGDEAEKETQVQKSEAAADAAPASDSTPAAAAPAAAVSTAEEPALAAQPEVPVHISIIDSKTAETDPIAEQIRDELLKSLEPEEAAVPEPGSESVSVPETEIEAAPETPSAPEVQTESEPVSEAAPAVEVKAEPEPKTEPEVVQEEPEEEEILDLDPAPVEEPAAPSKEPAPSYVRVNVMERIVEDKIIYFMKQFEVCTCPRCKEDTIALTLTGLPAKYMVMDRFAVDPMISFLTSRLISQVTVEALKACTEVKEHPRH